MDKRLILAVAGTGKTTEIINKIKYNDKTLIITYTEANYKNLKTSIINKFNEIPPRVKIFSYFTFLYSFCFRPLKAGLIVKGIDYEQIKIKGIASTNLNYYMNKNKKMYHARLAKYCNIFLINDIILRLEKYFENIYIDEVQDFSGHDFNFLMNILLSNCNFFLVGDFFQHTFSTSNDGNVNKNLYNHFDKYISNFEKSNTNIVIDKTSFLKSKRCSKEVCEFIKDKLNIEIESYYENHSEVIYLEDNIRIKEIVENGMVIKLFYKEHYKYNLINSDNWGNSKGNTYKDVCVVLNDVTYKAFKEDQLYKLLPSTKNKLYVACSRPTNNLYFVEERKLKEYKKQF